MKGSAPSSYGIKTEKSRAEAEMQNAQNPVSQSRFKCFGYNSGYTTPFDLKFCRHTQDLRGYNFHVLQNFWISTEHQEKWSSSSGSGLPCLPILPVSNVANIWFVFMVLMQVFQPLLYQINTHILTSKWSTNDPKFPSQVNTKLPNTNHNT